MQGWSLRSVTRVGCHLFHVGGAGVLVFNQQVMRAGIAGIPDRTKGNDWSPNYLGKFNISACLKMLRDSIIMLPYSRDLWFLWIRW